MCLISISPYDLAEPKYKTDLDENEKYELLKMPSEYEHLKMPSEYELLKKPSQKSEPMKMPFKMDVHLKKPSPLCPPQPLNLAPTTPRCQSELAMEQATPKNEDLLPLYRMEPLIEPSGPLCLSTLSPRWRCVHDKRELISASLRPELFSPGSSSSLSPSVGKTEMCVFRAMDA